MINTMRDYDKYKRMMDEVILYAVSRGWRGDNNILWNIGNPYKGTYYFSKDMDLLHAKDSVQKIRDLNKDDYIEIIPIYELWDVKGIIWEVDFLKCVFGENKIPTGMYTSPESLAGKTAYKSVWRILSVEMIDKSFEERIEFLHEWVQNKEEGCSQSDLMGEI